MQMTETVKTSTQRITVIDAMRGIALIGICLTHAMQYFGAFPPAPIETPFPWIGTLDEMFSWLIRYLVFAKFYIIFSFLFGLSFFIQMDRAAQKGIDFRPRFLWRLTLLLIIGYLHSLIFHMDILIIYAIVGFPDASVSSTTWSNTGQGYTGMPASDLPLSYCSMPSSPICPEGMQEYWPVGLLCRSKI